MALSHIVKQLCPTCGKVAVQATKINFGTSKLISLECGHIINEDVMETADYSSIVSSDGRRPMPYQIEAIQFMEQANGRCLIADEQGLGKTIEVLGLLKLHPEMLPAVIVTKTTLKRQMHHEIIRWCGVQGYLTQVIQSGKEKAMPAFDVFIVTYDLLKKPEMFDLVDVKTVIIDECQAIKNHTSDRAVAVQKLCKAKNVEHIIGLSGTYIKNNAGEAFTMHNLLKPAMHPTYTGFVETHCDSYYNGYGYKIGGLKNPAMFHELTKDYVIRRTKEQVLPELPPLNRKFYHVELDPKLNKAYASAQAELEDLYYSDSPESMTSMIAVMTKMRKITGISKTIECADFVVDFLESCDRKIVIFVHHHAAKDLLQQKLNYYLHENNLAECVMMTADLNADKRAEAVDIFRDGPARIMIASTLAAGEGLNLQFCTDAILLERQWNPANEEQAEGRFHRYGLLNSVTMTYMIASETIDEYFTELVEQKRAIVSSTLDNKEIEWEQNSLLKELATVLVTKGKKKFSL